MAGSALKGQSETPKDGVKSSGNVERNTAYPRQCLYGKMIFNTFYFKNRSQQALFLHSQSRTPTFHFKNHSAILRTPFKK